MMLLSSQAVMDSREFEILTSEEVDELKTVRIANVIAILLDSDDLSLLCRNKRISRRGFPL